MPRYLPRTMPETGVAIVRVDFNVPISGRRVLDTFDIGRALPLIRRLLRSGKSVVLLSHHSDERQTLAPLVPLLSRMLGRRVMFLRDLSGKRARSAVRSAPPGTLFLGENVRFWRGEREASKAFALALAGLGDIFVNNAFGELHRPYASIIGIPRHLPSFAGPLVADELKMLDGFMYKPKRPVVGLFGGAKIKTKLRILERSAEVFDRVLVGGGIANAIFAARGVAVGRSLADGAGRGVAKLARSRKIVLPQDVVVSGKGKSRTVTPTDIGSSDRIFDIGPASRKTFCRILSGAGTVVWNGPLGFVEDSRYADGTLAVARALSRHRGRVLVGGGDTVAFLNRAKLLGKFKNISTGGGAMLAYLAGEKLPGLKALRRP